jgi:hypothetical protein
MKRLLTIVAVVVMTMALSVSAASACGCGHNSNGRNVGNNNNRGGNNGGNINRGANNANNNLEQLLNSKRFLNSGGPGRSRPAATLSNARFANSTRNGVRR